MKKRILLLTAIAGLGYLVFSSNVGGPAIGSAGNRTGAKSTTTNCGGGGCHGTGTSTTVTITVDSATTTTAVTKYKPGKSYTIKIHGTNTSSLPKFGFEFAAVSGSGVSQIQAGSFPTPTPPVFNDPSGGINFIEQGSAITGTTPGVYDASFTWNAPATAVGNITMYCTLNAVNGNGSADAADISGNTFVTLTPIVPGTSVDELSNNIGIKACPNPVTNILNLQTENAGNYSVSVYDISGKSVFCQNMEVAAGQNVTINTSDWAAGMYIVVLEKEGSRQVIPVVKK